MSENKDWLLWRPWFRDSFLNDKNKDVVFWFTIAAKIDGGNAPEIFREKAWEELLKRGIKEPEITLHYLSANAPEPFNFKARKLLDKYLAKKNPS